MIVRESLKRDVARIIIWYPVRWIIGMMPVRLSVRLFRLLAGFHLRLKSGESDQLRANIRRAIPGITNLDQVIRKYLENHYIDRLHIFTYPKLQHPGNLGKICSIDGLGHLNEALACNKGAIIVLGHYGPIQLPLFQLGQAGYPIIQVGLPTDEGLSWIGRNVAFRLRMKYEKMIPVRILPANEFLRPLFQHLKKNGTIMMNIDPAGGGRWLGRLIWKPFFGYPVPFPMGAALLSQKTGAPILPLSIHRTTGNRYLFRIHPASTVATPGESPEQFVENLVEWYEAIVMQDPGLWHFWDEFQPGKLISSETI